MQNNCLLSTSIAVLSTAALFLSLPAWLPQLPVAGLDQSWVAVLEYAYAHEWKWGSDIAITFGPLGFLYSRYFDPSNYTTLILCWIFLSLSIGAGLSTLVRASNFPIAAAGCCFAIIAAFTAFTPDVIFFSIPLMTVLVWSTEKHFLRTLALFSLVVSSAVISLVKVTGIPLCLLSLILIDIGELLKRGRAPKYVIFYVLLIFAAWGLSGQRFSDLTDFIKNSASVVEGYDAAMQQFGPAAELAEYAMIGTIFLLTVVGFLARSKTQYVFDRLAIFLMFCAFVGLSFRSGFVRHDLHSLIAWHCLCAGSALFILYAASKGANPVFQLLAITLPVAAYSASVVAYTTVNGSQPPSYISPLLSPGAMAAALESAALFLSGSPHPSLQKELSDRYAEIAAASPLPTANGTIDVIPSYQMDLIASSADYHPRPVFQGYAAFTPRLAQLNGAFFQSNRAPQNVIFGFDLMDGRYPSTIDSLIWPALLARYQPEELKGEFLLLKKRNEDVVLRTTPAKARTISLNSPSKLWTSPDAQGVWASVHLEESMLGKISRLLWKPPVIEIVVTQGFRTRRFRLVPGNAEAGFLLSPLVENSKEFLELYLDGAPRTGREISQIEISIPEWARRFYKPIATVSLEEMTFAPARSGPLLRDDQRSGLLRELIATRRELSLEKVARKVGTLALAPPIGALGSLSATIPVAPGKLAGADLLMVTFGKKISDYSVEWHLTFKSSTSSMEIGSGIIESANVKDWEPARLNFPDVNLPEAGQLQLDLSSGPYDGDLNPMGVPLYTSLDKEAAIINDVPQAGVSPKLTLIYDRD